MEVIKLIADIIKTEMQLDDERVLIYNQKWNLPNIKGIFIYLNYISSQILSNNKCYKEKEDGYYEIQTMTKMDVIGLNISSANSEARERKEEIILALKSTYADQVMERYAFRVASIPMSFNDVSQLEASAMLNRYVANINVISGLENSKKVEYYDTFSNELKRS